MASDVLRDDFSNSFHRVSSRLRTPENVTYRQFRAGLTPRFFVVWRDIAAAYLGFVVVAAGLWSLRGSGIAESIAQLLLGAAAFGYLHHYLSLFLHEAAHYNLWRSRAANDRLANLFVGLPQCYAVAGYRGRHFDHHRHLGMPEDPENYYFHALSWRLLLWIASGAKTAAAVGRRVMPAPGPRPAGKPGAAAGLNPVALGGVVAHAAIVGAALLNGAWVLAGAWTFGFLIAWPLFSTVREILEHRDAAASAAHDYARTPHGAVSRIFGTGPLASSFGAAGFNRHLLHHWDPQLSYTRLREAEQFLLRTELSAIIRERQSSYVRTFAILWE